MKQLLLITLLSIAPNLFAQSFRVGTEVSGFLNGSYWYFNKIVNLNPAADNSCPEIQVENYDHGF